MAIIFLDVEDMLEIHALRISLYGGDPGLRDTGLLESAVAQPMASFGGEYLHAFPYDMAAAYLFHIVMNHPFIDGNKRTGAACGLAFLRMNDLPLATDISGLVEMTLAVAQGQAGKAEIAAFLRRIAC